MQVVVSLDAAAVPLLEGARECAAGGYLSSLHAENARAAAAVQGDAGACDAATLALLVDPQTGVKATSLTAVVFAALLRSNEAALMPAPLRQLQPHLACCCPLQLVACWRRCRPGRQSAAWPTCGQRALRTLR